MPQLKIPYLTFSLDTGRLLESIKQFDPLVESGHQVLGETPHILVCGFLAACGAGALSLWSYLLLHLSQLLSFEQSWARAAVTAIVLISVAVECFRGLTLYARWVLEANGGDQYSYAKVTGLDKVVPIEITTYTNTTTTTTTMTTTAPVAVTIQPLETMAEKSAALPISTTSAPALPSVSTTSTTTTSNTPTVARGRMALRSGFGMSMAEWSSSDEEQACAWQQWARGLKLATQLKGMRHGVLGEGEEQRWASMRW